MTKFFNRVSLKTSTTGTGTVSLGDPITTAFFTPAEAGMENGDEVAYQILDGGDVEVGVGTYSTGSPATFSRDTVIKSRIGGVAGTSKINLSGNAVVRFGLEATELNAVIQKLDGIESGADVTDATNVAAAGAFMKASDDLDDISEGTTNKHFTSTLKSKLDGIEAGADVTDATNVAAAGAIMDGDFSSNGLMTRTGAGTYGITAIGTSAGTVAAGDDSRITGAIQTGSHAATSVIGRSANSTGDAADIAASTNDRILARVSNALSWVQLTIGMIPDSLITFAKLASGAIASFGEFNTATASKLLSTASVWASPVSLTDGATIAVDLNNGYDFTVTLGGNRTLGAPSNVRHGKKGIIWVSASGSTRTLTLHVAWVLEADAEEGPYEIATTERLGICYVCDDSTVRVTGILRYS